MTQKELGKLLGITGAAVSAYEVDKNQPDFDMLQRIAAIFGVSTDFLVGRTDAEKGDTAQENQRPRQAPPLWDDTDRFFGRKLKGLMETHGVSETDLADHLNLSPIAIKEFIRGKVPDPGVLTLMADYFSVYANPPMNDRAFSERLSQLRRSAGLSVSDLSDLSGVPTAYIGLYEAYGDWCTGEHLIRLATALNVSASYLQGRSDDPKIKNQLPPELEQLVDEIVAGKLTADDVRLALKMLRLARGQEPNDP
jgi:transcriptional regulator with XRE-family HTH domain